MYRKILVLAGVLTMLGSGAWAMEHRGMASGAMHAPMAGESMQSHMTKLDSLMEKLDSAATGEEKISLMHQMLQELVGQHKKLMEDMYGAPGAVPKTYDPFKDRRDTD